MGSYCSAESSDEGSNHSRNESDHCCSNDSSCRPEDLFCCCFCFRSRSNDGYHAQKHEHFPPLSQPGFHSSHWYSLAPTAQNVVNSDMNLFNPARFSQRPMQYAPMVEYIPTSPAASLPYRQLVSNRGVTNPINYTVYPINRYVAQQNPLQSTRSDYDMPNATDTRCPPLPI